MFELLAAKLGGIVSAQVLSIATNGIFGFAALYIMKRIPRDNIKLFIRSIFYPAGVAMTLGLAKWKYTKKWWNRIGEPWLVDLVDDTAVEALTAWKDGMRSDN